MVMERIPEVDIARGIALLLMLASNLLMDLEFFGIASFPQNFFLSRIAAGAFIFIAGLSLHLAFLRHPKEIRGKAARRFALLLSLGIAISAVTFLAVGKGWVVFGILHFLAVSTLLGFPLCSRKPKAALAAGMTALALGALLGGARVSFPWLIFLGIMPSGFYSLDYFPILPWFSVFAFGLFFGKKLYPRHSALVPAEAVERVPASGLLSLAGKKTLPVYLAHQPALVALLWLAFPQKVLAALAL